MKISEKEDYKSKEQDFLKSIQKELNVFLSIPDNKGIESQNIHFEAVKNTSKESKVSVKKKFEFQRDTKVANSVTNYESEIMNLDYNGTKSANSILQINKIRNAVSTLERKLNNEIAKKYLTGFLEERGFVSFKEFVTSLA